MCRQERNWGHGRHARDAFIAKEGLVVVYTFMFKLCLVKFKLSVVPVNIIVSFKNSNKHA